MNGLLLAMIVSGASGVYGSGGQSTLARNTAGLLLNESFASLSGWTCGADFAADSSKPLYVVYRSTVALLARTAGENATIRDCAVYFPTSGAWYLLYDSAPNVGNTWTAHLAKSTDKGRSWTRLGSISSFNHGTTATWSMSGTMQKGGDGYIYTFVLNCGALSGGIPAVPYTTQTYRVAEADIGDVTKWLWVIDTPALGAAGEFDSTQSSLTMWKNISGTIHGWHCATRNTDNFYSTGHGTFNSGLTGAFTKDGAPDDASAIDNNTTGSYPENPKVWQSATLGKWIKATNGLTYAVTHAEANDIYVADAVNGFSGAGSYRVRVQREATTVAQDTNAGPIGLPTPYLDDTGSPLEESDGAVGWLFDANDADTSVHQNRDCCQGQALAITSALKFTAPTPGTAGVEYAVKTLSHTDIVIEVPVEFLRTDAGTSDFCVVYRHDGHTSDANGNGYVVRVSSIAASAITLYKLVNGALTSLATSTQTMWIDPDSRNLEMNRIRIECIGSTHKVYWMGPTALINTIDSTFSSGTSVAIRATGSVFRVHGCRAYTSKTVTVKNCGAGAEVILRGASGAIFDVQNANGSGVATLTSNHFPMYSVGLGSKQYTPLDGGRIWGGDTLTVIL